MTPEQTAEIMVKAKDSFQKWKDIDKPEFVEMIKTWHECLEDMPYEFARKSMIDYIKSNQRPPTIYDIRKPWNEHLDEVKEITKQLHNIYDRTIQNYPCYKDTMEVRNEWARITGRKVENAERFERQLIDYVRGCEKQSIDPMPFEEYMKGAKQIE